MGRRFVLRRHQPSTRAGRLAGNPSLLKSVQALHGRHCKCPTALSERPVGPSRQQAAVTAAVMATALSLSHRSQ